MGLALGGYTRGRSSSRTKALMLHQQTFVANMNLAVASHGMVDGGIAQM